MFINRFKGNPLAIVALWAFALNGWAATFTQTSNSVASLVAAITAANSNGQNDIIDLGGFTFTLITANNGDNGTPIINADSAHTLSIRNGIIERSTQGGTPEFRLLEVSAGASLSLDGVTLRNGLLSAAGSNGGAILVSGGTISLINNSILTNNVAADGGGAIYLGADATATTISNSAFTNNNAGIGGAIYVDADASLDLLTGSLFSSNEALTGAGGGLLVSGVGGDTTLGTLSNSTFTGNSAATDGGGIALVDASVTNLTNLTIASNNATVDGGGIAIDAAATVANLSSSIIALNTDGAAPAAEPDLSNNGTITTFANNIIGTDGGHAIVNNLNNNQVGTNATPLDPVIGPLQNNGGATQTRALLPGSTAIDRGINPLSLAVDQRGSGFIRVRGAAVDVGAFEIQDCAAIGDTDGDGVCNDADNCSNFANADQANSDSDNFGNACDNCDLVPNNNQENVDGDEFGDDCDSCQDTDGDGFGNPDTDTSDCPEEDEFDNCPLVANPEQEDTDDDELGDKCDTIPGGATVIPAPPPPPGPLPPVPPGIPPVDAGAPGPGVGPGDLDGVDKAPNPDLVVTRSSGEINADGAASLGDEFDKSYDIEEGSGCSLVNGTSSYLPLLMLLSLSLVSRRIRRRL